MKDIFWLFGFYICICVEWKKKQINDTEDDFEGDRNILEIGKDCKWGEQNKII